MQPRVIIADPDFAFGQLLAYYVSHRCDAEVVAQACDGREAFRLCERLRPVALIAELRLPGLDGIALLRETRSKNLGTSVIFYTHENRIDAALAARPAGLVRKSEGAERLHERLIGVTQVHRGSDPSVIGSPAKHEGSLPAWAQFSEMERAILSLVASGCSTKEIADKLDKSPHTVSHHRQRLMNKLNCHSAVALANFARTAHL